MDLKVPKKSYRDFCLKQNLNMLNMVKEPENKILSQNKYIYPICQNMVVTVTMIPINQIRIMGKHLNMEFKPSKFAAVVMRILDRNSKTTALVFASGKSVCVGGKSIEEIRTQLQKYRRLLVSLGCPADFIDIKRHNKVCNSSVPHEIDLARMSLENNLYCTYCPETFPGLIRLVPITEKRSIIFLIFDSGKYIVMGLKEDGEEIIASKMVLPDLFKYKAEKSSANLTSNQKYNKRIEDKISKTIQNDLKKKSKEGKETIIDKILSTKDNRLEIANVLANITTSKSATVNADIKVVGKKRNRPPESDTIVNNNSSENKSEGVISSRTKRRKNKIDNLLI